MLTFIVNSLTAPIKIGTLRVLGVVSHRERFSILMGSGEIGRRRDAVSLILFPSPHSFFPE
jgi:hypothetical protein